MKKLLILSSILALLKGASIAAPANEQEKPGTATCQVCRYNRDLACVEFRLKPNTPQFVYAGTRYCFCSDDCRSAFAKSPQKYLPKRK